jgi:uncharacterized iron-regulated membrane protein
MPLTFKGDYVSETANAIRRRFRLRPATRWLHTWGGITLGAVVSVICLTGSLIVFRQEIEKVRWPRNSPAAAVSHQWSLDSAVREIDRILPGALVTRVQFPASPNDPYVFQARASDKQTHRLVVDASTGQVLGELQQTTWLVWVIDLHRNMLAGKSGRQIVGGVGILWAVLGATGLLLWVLGGGRWHAWVRVRSGGTRRFNFDLHRVSGLWALLFIVVASFTGVGLSYPQTLRKALEAVTGRPASMQPPRLAKTAKPQTRSLDKYLANGRAAMPDGTPMEMRMPESAKAAVYLRLRRAGDLLPAGSNRVFLDPASGRALSTEVAANWPLGIQLFQSLQPIHYGEFGGLPVKILWSFLGVTPALLFVTGLLVWWRPNKPGLRRQAYKEARAFDIPLENAIAEPIRQSAFRGSFRRY